MQYTLDALRSAHVQYSIGVRVLLQGRGKPTVKDDMQGLPPPSHTSAGPNERASATPRDRGDLSSADRSEDKVRQSGEKTR